MAWTPKETNRLLVFAAAELARKRLSRGLKLNHPEALAILTDEIFEEARAGKTHAEVVQHVRGILCRDDVMEGVPEMLTSIQVDALFPDGTRLVTVTRPIGDT